MTTFAYTAVRPDGPPLRGTIDAADRADAERTLAALGLTGVELGSEVPSVAPGELPSDQPAPIEPVPGAPSPATPAAGGVRRSRVGPAELQTFNEYLLQISRAGLPVEGGLSVLAGELRSPALKRAIEGLLTDLRAGVPLEVAVAGRRAGFPPLYGRLLDAGIQSADLSGVLSRFGQHLQTVADLRNGLWRACAYPAVVLLALCGLLTFLGYGVLPRYFQLLGDIHVRQYDPQARESVDHLVSLPVVAYAMLYLGRAMPALLALAAAAGAGLGVLYGVLRRTGRERVLVERMTRVPLLGRPMRDSFVAAWLDVAAIGTAAGLDLPKALRLAGDAVALPSLRRDSAAMAKAIEQGRAIGPTGLSLLPGTVPMTIDMATGPGQLPRALGAMAGEFRRQAERQIAALPGRVMPALLVAVGLLAGGIMYSLWSPLIELLNTLLSF